jgi:serine/threonine-protein kinase
MPHVSHSAAARASVAVSHPPAPPVIDDWQLVELLHRGHWCSLWRARPAGARPTLFSQYALKLEQAADGDWGWQMLRREAAVSKCVSQRHLISVLSSQTAKRPAYIVMPILEGVTLSDALATQLPMPPGHALWIARQVAEGLGALHEGGWLHGDVKPENVIVQPDGHATLIDLGFAQRSGEAASLAARMFCGTLRYAAPERFVSTTSIGGASDCYALGAMLFEMLAGRPPFVSHDPHQLVVAHVEQTPPDVREFSPHVPREVSRLLAQLLAKNPLRRPTMGELVPRLCRLEITSLDSQIVVTSAHEPALPA